MLALRLPRLWQPQSRRPMLAAVFMNTAAVVACTRPDASRQRATGEVLYVANSREGTVTQYDPQTGRRVGGPVPAGRAPMRLLAGEGGLLAMTLGAGAYGRLTHVTRRGGWEARPVPLEPAAQVTAMAGDGGAWAAIVYH